MPVVMLFVSLLFFVFSAGTGFTIAYAILTRRLPTPKLPVFMHGVMSSIGLTLLLIYVIGSREKIVVITLGIFVGAALVGFYLFRNDIFKDRPGPRTVVAVHVLLALLALGLLLSLAYGVYVAKGLEGTIAL